MALATTRRLHLMMAITILFGFSAMFSIFQLSKVIHFQHLDFLYYKNVTELIDTLKKYPEKPVSTSFVKKKLEDIQTQLSGCNNLMNSLDRYVMKSIKTDKVIDLCENDMSLVSDVIEEMTHHKAPQITNPILLDTLDYTTRVFERHSKQLGEPVEKTGQFTIHIISSLIIPFSIFVVIFSIFIFRKIKIKTMHLQKAVTDLEVSEEEKRQLAYFDILTSLPNRNLFTELLEHEIHQVNRYDSAFALLYIDLDRFKFINDTLGHASGDELITEAGRRLNKCTRESDTLARFGGDEFLLILSGPNSQRHAALVAQKIIETISEPFILSGHEMHISASVGIAFCPQNGVDSDTLLKRADIAMYEAKANGKNRYHAYEENSISHKTEYRLDLEKDLRHAIERDELELHYQPVLNLNNFNTVGVEALLRWRHSSKGIISPLQFIPLAEESGLIEVLGSWVIHEACRQSKYWRETGGRPGFHIAINVSGLQLKNRNFISSFNHALDEFSLSPDAIDIEITESAFYGEDKNCIDNLNQLSEMGVRLLLDDFGTGFSSLSTLHGLPFDIIKIDRSFMDINHSKKRAMTKTVIHMAEDFNMTTVAEGVEDQATIDYLRSLNCDYAQGFLFQKPVPAPELDIRKNYKDVLNTSNITAINSR